MLCSHSNTLPLRFAGYSSAGLYHVRLPNPSLSPFHLHCSILDLSARPDVFPTHPFYTLLLLHKPPLLVLDNPLLNVLLFSYFCSVFIADLVRSLAPGASWSVFYQCTTIRNGISLPTQGLHWDKRPQETIEHNNGAKNKRRPRLCVALFRARLYQDLAI